jgi:hypothetical protein
VIVWLASYPRSGNTFLRVVLHRLYGVPTYSVYDDDDPVAQRIGPGLVGYRPKPLDRVQMTDTTNVFLVKTHKRCKADGYPAICLVRDGRDAVVSRARLDASSDEATDDGDTRFRDLLREVITRPYVAGQPSSETWGGNVLSWLSCRAPFVVLRYEDLIVSPRASVEQAVSVLLPGLVANDRARIPSFSELKEIDPGFFRRGAVESHRDEMPDDLHDLFWKQPDNRAAMLELGYA